MSISMENRQLFTVVHAVDHPGKHAAKMREELMVGHLNHIESILDQVVIAGPMFADDNKTVIGSLLIYKTENKEQALANLKADPYYDAGIWDKISINVFRGALGDIVGGKAY